MSYPGNPQGNPNEGYGYPDPNAPAGAYPPPAAPYGDQPVSPYGGPVPQQPAPMHDHSTTQLPTYSNEGSYSLDPSVSAPPTAPMQANPPMSAPPMSGPPMSGPPNTYGPVSGAPVFPAQPVGYPPVDQPKKKGIAVPILASLLALAVIAAGVFVGLYIDKSGKLDKSEKLSAQRQQTLDSTQKDLDTTKSDLQKKANDLTKAQQDLRGTQADSTEAKRQRDVIGKCLTLLLQFIEAANKGDQTTMQNKLNELDKPCDEASTLLGI
ncbi:hypothetical protein Drose_08985 [Dactylosporangium roseum]|uniref:Uncharacterized protein n=1 Tax=Dactylosporangium roseum TaxID=47989 RepID=A0ABY5Z9L3_9ACTN|nr:hypothetical protein [Dactylosporangium roseum]UWZ38359.1 hypothetical protein Drose_08985 [Dactylosporangium roseum]